MLKRDHCHHEASTVIAAVTSDPRREETSTAGNMQAFCAGSPSHTNPKGWELRLYGNGRRPSSSGPFSTISTSSWKHSFLHSREETLAYLSDEGWGLCDPRQVISALGASVFSFIEYA
jgi:hypothetical protein